MPFTLTLISAPANPAVSAELVAKVKSVIKVDTDFAWLMEGVACDFVIPAHPDYANLRAEVRMAIAGDGVDMALQPTSGRKKKLLMADMDSTMIQQECIDELADVVGLKEKVSDITARAMRGEIEFEPAPQGARWPAQGPRHLCRRSGPFADRITLTPGGKALIQTMKANGAYCALVSGGFTHFTARVRAELGFDEDRANTLLEQDGKLTGDVGMPILGKDAKRTRLHELVKELDIDFDDTMAVGDGANDLCYESWTLAPAVRSCTQKPRCLLRKAGYVIDHGDLTGLLFLQGYKAEDFVLA